MLVFPKMDGKSDSSPRAVIKATDESPEAIANGGYHGAAMIWEYMRIFMRDGVGAVPSPQFEASYVGKSVRDCVDYMNPWKPFAYRVWWKLFAALILAPITVPFFTCMLLGDITYMLFDRILPRREWPRELIDACDNVWDGRND